MTPVVGTAVGLLLLVWCAVVAVATAAGEEGKRWRHEGCVPCGTPGECAPLTSLCDGVRDCPAGEDEDRQFCDAHLLQRRRRFNDLEGDNVRINSRTPRPLLADQTSDHLPERTIRQFDDASSGVPLNMTTTPRLPIIVRTVTSLNSTNTSNLIFIHLPDDEGNHPTLLPTLTRDASLASNATFLNRFNVKTRNLQSRSKYKHSHAAKECCGHCVRCASSTGTCVAHSQLCDGQADCVLMEDEAPAFCQVFLQGHCPSGLAPCNGLCVPWAVACSESCVQRPHFEACFAVRRKQLDISFLNKSTADPPHLRIPLVPPVNGTHAVLRPALPAHPLPATLDSLLLTRPADSPFPNIDEDEPEKSHLPELNDKFIKVPGPSSNPQAENITASKSSTYSNVIYKCSPISLEDRIANLLSTNTLLLKSPTESSFLRINSEDLQTPSDISNRNTLHRLKAALANIHRNLLNFNKTLNESRSGKFSSHNYLPTSYHCVLASKGFDKELNSEYFLNDDSKAPSTDNDDVATDLISLDRNDFNNDTNKLYSSGEKSQPSLFENESNDQMLPVRENTSEGLRSTTNLSATTHRPELSELTEVLVTTPPPMQMMSPCPPIFTPVAHTCLAALPFSMTWQEAGEVCEKLGGRLAETRDISMLTAVAKFLRQDGSRANFWIGGFYDVVTSAWMWRSGAKMIMSTPFWGYRHTEECSELKGKSYSPARYPACTHHQQAPLNSTKGFCAALDAQFFYFITDHPCMHARKVLCSHNRTW